VPADTIEGVEMSIPQKQCYRRGLASTQTTQHNARHSKHHMHAITDSQGRRSPGYWASRPQAPVSRAAISFKLVQLMEDAV
jgi:hypothetical protein